MYKTTHERGMGKMSNTENENEYINNKESIIQKFLNNSQTIKIELYLLRRLKIKIKVRSFRANYKRRC